MSVSGYRIVRLSNGACSVHSLAHAETFHPVVGPVAEAQALYVRQLRFAERLETLNRPFVIWDVGLGAAANPLTVLRAAGTIPSSIHLLSFDQTVAALEFALSQSQHLGYLSGFEQPLIHLLREHRLAFHHGACSVQWEVHLADFPSLIASPEATRLAKPDLIMFDAFSPAKNPAMWTLPVFSNLFRLLDPEHPCVLPTYSRSTMLRVTLLLAGFFVGIGHATGEKEQTTIAATRLQSLDEPLDRRWLQRAGRSTSAEPLLGPSYRQAPLSPANWLSLQAHPQFASA